MAFDSLYAMPLLPFLFSLNCFRRARKETSANHSSILQLSSVSLPLSSSPWLASASNIQGNLLMLPRPPICIKDSGPQVTSSSHTASSPPMYSRVEDLFFPDCQIAGHVAFFGFMSEMKKPHDYPKALFMLQGTNTTLYAVTAAVIYRYGGRDVTSPALGSTGPVLRKVAYGVALPTVSSRHRKTPAGPGERANKAGRSSSPV